MEHQLKLHSESLQSRVEELEEENLELHNRIRALTEVNCRLIFILFRIKITRRLKTLKKRKI